MTLISSGALLAGGEGGGLDNSHLHVVEIARAALHASFQPVTRKDLQFGT